MPPKWTLADRLNLCRIGLVSLWTEHRRWSRNTYGEGIRVFYGYNRLPSSREKAFGGLVKVQDLKTRFPNQPVHPNLLYLISSSLPHFPGHMAKRAKQAGAKLVLNQNGVAYRGWYGEGWKCANRPNRRLFHMADHIIYQSAFCKVSAERFLGKRSDAETHILHNPVDTTYFRPPERPLSEDRKTTMLLAGSHWTPYRVRTALATLQTVRKMYRSARLVIAGRFCWHRDEGKARREVEDEARRLGVAAAVEIFGTYTQEEAPVLMGRCAVLLHTKYNDPCPRLVVEAMACGLPVVYSATGGVPELVGEDGGIGVPGPLDWELDHPPDPDDLAEAVEHVLQDRETYAGAARERAVRRFDVESWIRGHAEIFHQVIGVAKGP